MVFSIFVMLAQVGLEAYILGTLFHYVVKKDAKLEEFRSAISQCLLFPCEDISCMHAQCRLHNNCAAAYTSTHVQRWSSACNMHPPGSNI